MPKTILIGVGGAVGGGALLAILFLFVLGGESSSAIEDEELAAEAEAEAEVEVEPTPVNVSGKLGPHIILADRVFTLQSDPTAPRYVKLAIIIEFETFDEEWAHVLNGCVFAFQEGEELSPCKAEEIHLLEQFEEEIGTGRSLIDDAITSIVSTKSVTDIATIEGKDALRQEIKDAVDQIVYEPRVTRVLFTNFITQ